MRKCRDIIVAVVFLLVIIMAGQVAYGTGSYDERWSAFMYEIISPFTIKSDLYISIFPAFYEKPFEAYRVPDMKQTEFKEYYGEVPEPKTPSIAILNMWRS